MPKKRAWLRSLQRDKNIYYYLMQIKTNNHIINVLYHFLHSSLEDWFYGSCFFQDGLNVEY